MMNRKIKFILLLFFLSGLIQSCTFALAQEGTIDLIKNRSKLAYKSQGLRDPFQTYISKEKKAAPPGVDLAKLETKFKELKVQGIIWGTEMPQAIINNKVYLVGDKIEDAEILSIDNRGVSLISSAGIINLGAPGKSNVLN